MEKTKKVVALGSARRLASRLQSRHAGRLGGAWWEAVPTSVPGGGYFSWAEALRSNKPGLLAVETPLVGFISRDHWMVNTRNTITTLTQKILQPSTTWDVMHVLRSTLNSRKQQVIGAARPRISFWEFFPRFHISSGRKKTVSIAHVEIVALTFLKKEGERVRLLDTHENVSRNSRESRVFSWNVFNKSGRRLDFCFVLTENLGSIVQRLVQDQKMWKRETFFCLVTPSLAYLRSISRWHCSVPPFLTFTVRFTLPSSIPFLFASPSPPRFLHLGCHQETNWTATSCWLSD